MKPFDLTAALKGEPVVLRSGDKAHVKFQLKDCHSRPSDLVGYVTVENPGYMDEDILLRWRSDGRVSVFGERDDDIVGMWEPPKPTIRIGNMDVPEPEREPLKIGEPYYVPCIYYPGTADSINWNNDTYDIRVLKRGLVHKTREAAEQHAKALIALTASEEA